MLVEVYFLARGFNLYREAIEEAGLDEMAASIQSSESFTPIDELPGPCTCRPSWPWRIIGSTPIPASTPSPRRAPS